METGGVVAPAGMPCCKPIGRARASSWFTASPSLGAPYPTCSGGCEALSSMAWPVSQAVDAESATSGALKAALPILLSADARLRQEAAMAGKAKARSKGVRFGRPPVGAEKLDRVKSALADGMGIRPAARAAGVSPATVMWVSTGPCAAPVTA
jgi:hypothetical protein